MLYVLQGSPYPPVESSGISWTLESQAKLLVVDSPMVEDGVDFVVDQVPLYDALQHDLRRDNVRFRNKQAEKKTYINKCVIFLNNII